MTPSSKYRCNSGHHHLRHKVVPASVETQSGFLGNPLVRCLNSVSEAAAARGPAVSRGPFIASAHRGLWLLWLSLVYTCPTIVPLCNTSSTQCSVDYVQRLYTQTVPTIGRGLPKVRCDLVLNPPLRSVAGCLLVPWSRGTAMHDEVRSHMCPLHERMLLAAAQRTAGYQSGQLTPEAIFFNAFSVACCIVLIARRAVMPFSPSRVSSKRCQWGNGLPHRREAPPCY